MVTDLNLTMTLPKWRSKRQATRLLIEQWDRYFDNLLFHEQGHTRIGREATIEVLTRVEGISPKRTCDEMQTAVEELAQQVIRDYVAKDMDYDKETEHGLTQGARFP